MMRVDKGSRRGLSVRRWGALLLAVFTPATARPDGVPSLGEIREVYRKQSGQLDQLWVHFVYTSTPNAPESVVSKIDGFHIPFTVDVVMAFKGDQVRFEQMQRLDPKAAAKGPKIPAKRVLTYNGKVSWVYEENGPPEIKGNASADVWGHDAGPRFNSYDPFLRYQGFPTKGRLTLSLDGRAIDPLVLTRLGDPKFKVEPEPQPSSDGTPCVVVGSDEERLWLDPKLNLAQRERVWYRPGDHSVISRIQFSRHAEVRPGLWLARSLRRESFPDPARFRDYAEKPYRTETVEVKKIRADPVPDDLFVFHPPPGAMVFDTTQLPPTSTGQVPAVTYNIPDSSVSLEDVVAQAIKLRKLSDERVAAGSSSVWWYVGLNLVLIAVIAVAWAARSRRRAAS